jgi:deoxyribodipyrimidine photolyase
MSKNEQKITAADVAAKAVEEKLVEPTVPAQGERAEAAEKLDTVLEEDFTTHDSDGCDQSEEKADFKSRLKSLTEKLKEKKKPLLATVAVVAVATAAFIKFAAKTVVEEVVMTEDEISSADLSEDEKKDIADEIAAGNIGG